jgi:hypothetical protein
MIGVVSAAVLVTDAGISALGTCAAIEARLAAAVGCKLGSALVGFPDIELIAADTFALDVALL